MASFVFFKDNKLVQDAFLGIALFTVVLLLLMKSKIHPVFLMMASGLAGVLLFAL